MPRDMNATDPEAIRRAIRDGYAAIARGAANVVEATGEAPAAQSCCAPTPKKATSCCCGGAPTLTPTQVAEQIGYSSAELAGLPEGANMGLSCGNPTALASLRPGEIVLDLGSGGGFDVFLAGPRVGPTGRAIGVDMTPEMLAKARANAAAYTQRTSLAHVEFRLGEIEHLPVSDNSVDVVISNCVINLSADKPQVWREISRVLKPGGRVAVSDLALLRPLPAKITKMIEALISCIAGAVLVKETRRMARAAGLTDIVLTPKPDYLTDMADWKDPYYGRIFKALPRGTKPADFVTSLNVSARKPRRKAN